MKTKYNTGDEVLVPVKIKAAMTIGGEIYYIPADYDEKKVIPEGLIEGKAKIGKENYNKQRWKKKHEMKHK